MARRRRQVDRLQGSRLPRQRAQRPQPPLPPGRPSQRLDVPRRPGDDVDQEEAQRVLVPALGAQCLEALQDSSGYRCRPGWLVQHDPSERRALSGCLEDADGAVAVAEDVDGEPSAVRRHALRQQADVRELVLEGVRRTVCAVAALRLRDRDGRRLFIPWSEIAVSPELAARVQQDVRASVAAGADLDARSAEIFLGRWR